MITARVTVSAASMLGDSEVVYASTLASGGTVPDVGLGVDKIANAQLSLSITDPALQGVFTEGAVFDVTFAPAEVDQGDDTDTAEHRADDTPAGDAQSVPQLSPSDAPVVLDTATDTAARADYSPPPGE